MTIPETIFRAYDVRGVYGKDLTEEVATRIGQAFGTYLGGEGKEIVVGRDVRLSGHALESALVKGVLPPDAVCRTSELCQPHGRERCFVRIRSQ